MTRYILALETSSSVCGVALLSAAGQAVAVHALRHDATAEHAERLLPMVDELLARAGIEGGDLAAVAFGQGPGGFTGLRVACGVAQGMALALDAPVIPVESLLAVAERVRTADGLSPALHVIVQDARMGEVYLAAYRPAREGPVAEGPMREGSAGETGWVREQAAILLNAHHVADWLAQARGLSDGRAGHPSMILAGDALDAYPELSRLAADRPWLALGAPLRPDAETIALLAWRAWQAGAGVPPEQAAPLYVRDKVAYTTLERQGGAGGNPRAPDLPVSLEAMRHEHLDDVADIEHSVQSFPWTRQNFADGLQAGYGAWVARRAGRTVGFCMAMFAPDVAHVLVIGVEPAQQKRGTGALLLQRCEEEARSRGLTDIILEVRPSNRNALRFYKRHGFELLSMRKDYYPAGRGLREDACVLRKTLETGVEARA